MSILRFEKKLPNEHGWFEWRKNKKSKVILGRVYQGHVTRNCMFDLFQSRRIFSRKCTEMKGEWRGPMTYEFIDTYKCED